MSWEAVNSVAGVAGSVASIGAFSVAAYLFWQNLKDREVSQARMVSGWIVQRDFVALLATGRTHKVKTGYPLLTDLRRDRSQPLGMVSTIDVDHETHLIDFVIENLSEETITNITFRIFRKRPVQYYYQTIRELPGQHRFEDFALISSYSKEGKLIVKSNRNLKVQLMFTDAAGRRWERVTGLPVQPRGKKGRKKETTPEWTHLLMPPPQRIPVPGTRFGGVVSEEQG